MKEKKSLAQIRIASPCHEKWELMTGDEKSRFCQQCNLSVYNISNMTSAQAEEFINQQEGRVCVKYFQRYDGTITTSDCPTGAKQVRHSLFRLVGAAAVAAL